MRRLTRRYVRALVLLAGCLVLVSTYSKSLELSVASGQAPRSRGPEVPRRPAGPSPASSLDTEIKAFFSSNCFFCHNAKLKSGNLSLEQLTGSPDLTTHRDAWERVLQKLKTGEMPPKGLPRPPASDITKVTQWISTQFDRVDAIAKPDPGRVTVRRLNREEYNNTVRDLAGVNIRPADDFPQDDSGYGFDNIGDVLSLSPVLMEKYVASAEKVARTAVFGAEQLKPTLVRITPGARNIKPETSPRFDYDELGLSLPNALHFTHRFPVDGEYMFRLSLGGVRPAGSDPIDIAFWVDGKQVEVKQFDPARVASFEDYRQDLGGMKLEFRTRLTEGPHWIAASILRLYEGLPASYAGPNPAKRPPPPPPSFRAPRNAPPERVAQLKKEFEERIAARLNYNDARVGSVEIGGPYEQLKGPSAARLRNVYSCGHLDGKHLAGCGRKIVASLAHRAYRRTVTPAEVNQLLSFVTRAKSEGDSFEEGIALSLQAMLVSPHFLFRIEKDRSAGGEAGRLSDHEIASRLSYFLWSSMPDNELLGAADRGTLTSPAVLSAQVRRMLKDPKSRALVENFGGQWLELRKLESVKPDRQKFPEFEEYLRMSMREETDLFLDHIIREDRSVLELIDSNYTFLNERLAKFYNVPNVKGPEFRKVILGAETHRGGLLSQASVLTVSSYSTRTSPVLRGRWILENILNAPPPPPPPDVPNLDEGKISTAASMRLQLEEHRKNATCASCHVRMDPLGFGLENFDAIGAYRTRDGNAEIDSSGTLPDGRSFKGARELKAIVKSDSEAFAECLSEKMLTFALGRGVEKYDRPALKKIARAAIANQYRFSSFVMGIITSVPFQMRRGA